MRPLVPMLLVLALLPGCERRQDAARMFRPFDTGGSSLGPCPVLKQLRPCGAGRRCPDGDWCEYGVCMNPHLEASIAMQSHKGYDCTIPFEKREGPLDSPRACRRSEGCRVSGACGHRPDKGCVARSLTDCLGSLRCRRMGECWLHEGACGNIALYCHGEGLCLQLRDGLVAYSDADCDRARICEDAPSCSALAGECVGATIVCKQRDRIARLICLLRDRVPELRWKAADALGELGAEARAAAPHLERLLADRDAYVRQQARAALDKIRRTQH